MDPMSQSTKIKLKPITNFNNNNKNVFWQSFVIELKNQSKYFQHRKIKLPENFDITKIFRK